MYHHMHTGTRKRETLAVMRYHVAFTIYAHTYPAATKKGVAGLCLCQLPTMYAQMHVHKISRYIYV